jgi:hypothetical protein
MTRGKSLGRVQTVQASPPLRERRKAVLTCSRCGHESPVDGDWVEVFTSEGVAVDCDGNETLQDNGGIEVHCPVCNQCLTTRTPSWD